MSENLRDAQHAHNLYTQQRLNFSPKVKYLYHCFFELTDEARSKSPISVLQNNLINVLVKSANLPGFSAQIETKQQYNRKKHIQTRIDYDPVTFRFHDDNAGSTMSLLKEYYNYYFSDGKKAPGQDFDPRDKFSGAPPAPYGLDNQFEKPFFKQIKLFQLSRQEWNSYTLINPIVQKWEHSDLDNADGAGITENAMTVLYESVLYDNGSVSINGDPDGFAAQETGYDYTPSPYTNEMANFYQGQQYYNVLNGGFSGGGSGPGTILENVAEAPSLGGIISDVLKTPGGIPGVRFPPGSEIGDTINTIANIRNIVRDPSSAVDLISRNPDAIESLTRLTLGTGNYNSAYNSRNSGDYNELDEQAKDEIQREVLGRLANGDRKVQSIANTVINTVRNRR